VDEGPNGRRRLPVLREEDKVDDDAEDGEGDDIDIDDEEADWADAP
jgi:hypothetical protein